MLAFQQYQADFTAHIRDPHTTRKPAGVATKRMAVYREIVFNNFMASVSACFPVLHQILGKRKFKNVVRLCFAQHHFDSPLFREISLAFVNFLQNIDLGAYALPPFSAQLAHYEWAELYVSNLSTWSGEQTEIVADDGLLSSRLLLNPAHALLAYDYPVHLLSRKHATSDQIPTYLCLFTNASFKVTFIQLNQVTYQLLQLLQTQAHTSASALQTIAQQLQHPHPEIVMQFGLQAIASLQRQGVLSATAAA